MMTVKEQPLQEPTADPNTIAMAEESENDEEEALLYGKATGNPQEDESENPLLPQQTTNNVLRSRKETGRQLSFKSVRRSSRRNRFCRRPTVHCLSTCLLWFTVVSLAVAAVWYSVELFTNGTDPQLIAWFSAGAFVLLGFPISMWGILGHLTNYNSPNTQIYIVRILWMVPIYSVQSWLAMRFHKRAVLFETMRDCYESYVLYSFLQFLIQVLGGEQALIHLLKDKSPTRGVHMWGLQYCCRPWLMGQPVRRDDKTIQWESPFFRHCKLGVLQYVLLKLLCVLATLIMEKYQVYNEGNFHWKSGYLYICILTNTSQCWALYCLIFFYYATKTELSPIRPLGKFLAVKALVFFTWWQSVAVSVLYQMDLIPSYRGQLSEEEIAKGIQDYLICIEMFLAAVVHTIVFPHNEYSMAAVRARENALRRNCNPQGKRLGRGANSQRQNLDSREDTIEMVSIDEDSSIESHHRGFMQAVWDSAIPRDLHDNTMGMIRGEYRFDSKTLLHHAATSDTYHLFSRIKDTDSE